MKKESTSMVTHNGRAMHKLTRTMGKRVVAMVADGYTTQTIAKSMQVSNSRVYQLKKEFGAKAPAKKQPAKSVVKTQSIPTAIGGKIQLRIGKDGKLAGIDFTD